MSKEEAMAGAGDRGRAPRGRAAWGFGGRHAVPCPSGPRIKSGAGRRGVAWRFGGAGDSLARGPGSRPGRGIGGVKLHVVSALRIVGIPVTAGG